VQQMIIIFPLSFSSVMRGNSKTLYLSNRLVMELEGPVGVWSASGSQKKKKNPTLFDLVLCSHGLGTGYYKVMYVQHRQ
jgi:hypothetical protein